MTSKGTRFWLRLESLESKFSAETSIPRHISEYAAKFDDEDPVYARFCRECFDPKKVKQLLARVRFIAETRGVDEAQEELTRAQESAQHIEMQAIRRNLVTGYRQNAILDEHRKTAIRKAQADKMKRQPLVEEVARASRLSGGDLKRWIVKRLADDHGIVISYKTVERDLRELKIVGHTG